MHEHEPAYLPPALSQFEDHNPVVALSAFVAPNAVILGDVMIGAQSSIWYGCILRGDVNSIRIGERTNLQDGCVVHVNDGPGGEATIGNDVTIGHMALVHACQVEDGAFIGMRACLLDRVIVEGGAVVAAGAVVSPGKHVRSGELWAGVPARPVRMLSLDDVKGFRRSAGRYVDLAERHRRTRL